MTPFENEIDQILTDAESLIQEERPVEALNLLDRVRELAPDNAWMLLFRGVALSQLERTDEAIIQFIAASDAGRTDVDIQVETARHLALMEQFQDALICANRAVEADADDAGGHAIQGEVLEHLGRIAEAVPARETALTLEPDDADSRYYLAVDLCDTGRYDDAYRIAEPLFNEYPEDVDIIRLHGACLSYLGRHEEAMAKWAELERLEGITPNLLHNRASTLDAMGLRNEALATINEAITIEPDMGASYFTRGLIHEHAENEAEAIEDYLQALTCDANHVDAAMNMVELAVAVGAAPLVIDRIEMLLGLEPASATLLYAKGRLAVELGELELAQKALEEAVRREPSHALAWYALSMLYGMAGDAEATIGAADRALKDFANDPGLWLTRGQALHELKRYPEALASYDHAIALDPADATAWFHLGRLLLLDLERPADARGALKEAQHLQPDNDHATWMLALCHLRLGHYTDTAREIIRVLKRNPNHLWGRLVRAALYAQQGKYEAALADLQVVADQGYDIDILRNEPLYATLFTDPRFAALCETQAAEGKR